MSAEKSGFTVGIIGAGNMGEAFAGAILRGEITTADAITVSDIAAERLEQLASEYGVRTADDNGVVFDESDVVILAVKPQQMDAVLAGIASRPDFSVDTRKIVISVAAGIRIEKMASILYGPLDPEARALLPLVRVMPNTPALVLAGVSGMAGNEHVTDADRERTRLILSAMGDVHEFDEPALDAVTAMSGSGPAYVFYFIESMLAAGISVGFSGEKALELTLGTIKGAVRLLEERGEAPSELRRKVTSPGGTTEAAVRVLDEHRVKAAVVEAVEAAKQRAIELSG